MFAVTLRVLLKSFFPFFLVDWAMIFWDCRGGVESIYPCRGGMIAGCHVGSPFLWPCLISSESGRCLSLSLVGHTPLDLRGATNIVDCRFLRWSCNPVPERSMEFIHCVVEGHSPRPPSFPPQEWHSSGSPAPLSHELQVCGCK